MTPLSDNPQDGWLARLRRTPFTVVCIWVVLALGTLTIYARVVRHEFLRCDDNTHVYENVHVRYGITWDGLRWAFAIHGPALWQPLAWISHQVDSELFGVAPERAGFHHAVNLLLHVGSVLILFEALRRMTGHVWPSALVAALYGMHPIGVEPVAWISERREVLGAFFWMLTLLAYWDYARRGGRGPYLRVAACLGIGLMAKPMLVTLPCVLFLLDFWPLRRWQRLPLENTTPDSLPEYPQHDLARLVAEKLPLLALSAISSYLTVLCQRSSISNLAGYPFSGRLGNAVLAYGLYLRKMVWPHDLAMPYPYDRSPNLTSVLATGFVVLLISAFVMWQGRKRPYLAVGWLCYLGTLVPVLGLVHIGAYVFSDHYACLPLVGIYIALAWSARAVTIRWPHVRYAMATGIVSGMVILAAVAWNQVGYWRNGRTLFTHTLEVTGDNPVGQLYLGSAFEGLGLTKEALACYEKSRDLSPQFASAHYNVGVAQQKLGNQEEACKAYRTSLELDPNSAETENNLGSTLEGLGKSDKAIEHYRKATALKPDFPEAHYNLGTALARKGLLEDARQSLRKARKLEPDNEQTHHNLRLVEAALLQQQ